MPVTITTRGEKLSGSDLVRLEKQLGIMLPHEYREFLLQNNIAVPQPNQFRGKKIVTSVSKFFGIGGDKTDDLLAQNAIYEGRLPTGVLPIALAGGGNLIAISVKDGTVFFWDHEQEAAEDEEPSFQNMEMLAPSFSAFLRNLEPFQQKSVSLNPKDVVSVKLKPGFHEKFKGNS